MEGVIDWVERNPWIAAIIGLGGLLLILWLLGFFSSSQGSSTSNANSLAAAYYNAEATQTAAGTQLQMATEAYAAQTAQDQIQANGAEAIAATQANMYTTIGQQNASTTTALGNDQLLASDNSNDDALAMANTAANYDYLSNVSANNASEVNNLISTVWPQEISYTGGAAAFTLPNIGSFGSNTTGTASINQLVGMGYTLQQAQYLTGVQGV